MAELLHVDPKSSIWSLLDLPDADLERVDLVVLNLAVARGIKSLCDLDVQKYIDVVDDWTEQIKRYLVTAEPRNFGQSPHKYKNDLNFYRIGAVAGFLGRYLGIKYIESQFKATRVNYSNPSDLFLNGVVDTKRGTCGSLSTLHVAICRRMGWPVSLASTGTHWLSRYDDGKNRYNIECSQISESGVFSADPDSYYINEFKLPTRAMLCGSELRPLTAREMLGAFLAKRARHYVDSRQHQLADSSYSLARHLFPNHRQTLMRACAMIVKQSVNVFEPDETGHMNSFFQELAPQIGIRVPAPAYQSQVFPETSFDSGVQYASPLATRPKTVVPAGCFSPNEIKV